MTFICSEEDLVHSVRRTRLSKVWQLILVSEARFSLASLRYSRFSFSDPTTTIRAHACVYEFRKYVYRCTCDCARLIFSTCVCVCDVYFQPLGLCIHNLTDRRGSAFESGVRWKERTEGQDIQSLSRESFVFFL